MMMNAVSEEHSFGIYCKVLEILTFSITFIVVQDIFQYMTQREVIFTILVPVNVATPFCSLAQMISILFLLKSKAVPSRYLITDDFYISELVYQVPEISFFFSASGHNGKSSYKHHSFKNTFHMVTKNQ